MEDKLTISVVIPAYKGECFIPAALDSLMNQSDPADEIIVVDDGCPQNSGSIAESYCPGVIVVRQQNRGMAAARNAGARAVSSQWIAFLDQDDRCAPDRIAKTRALAAANSDAKWIFGGWVQENTMNGKTFLVDCPSLEEVLRIVRFRCTILPSFSAIRRDAFWDVGGFPTDTDLIGVDDHALLLRFLRRHGSRAFARLSGVAGTYLLHRSNYSGKMMDHLRGRKALIRDQVADLSGVKKFLWTQALLALAHRDVSLLMRENRDRGFLSEMTRSLACWPFPHVALPNGRYKIFAHMLLTRFGVLRPAGSDR